MCICKSQRQPAPKEQGIFRLQPDLRSVMGWRRGRQGTELTTAPVTQQELSSVPKEAPPSYGLLESDGTDHTANQLCCCCATQLAHLQSSSGVTLSPCLLRTAIPLTACPSSSALVRIWSASWVLQEDRHAVVTYHVFRKCRVTVTSFCPWASIPRSGNCIL